MFAAGAGAAIVFSGCSKSDGGAGGSDSDSAPSKQMAKEDDKQAEEALKETALTLEGREWVKKYPKSLYSSHTLKEDDDGNGTLMAGVVERLYAAGAQKIVIKYVKLGQADILEAFIVVMPTDAAARQKVLALDPELSQLQQQRPTKEFGQKYLFYSLD